MASSRAEYMSLPNNFGLDYVTALANGTWVEVTCATFTLCVKRLCTFTSFPLVLLPLPEENFLQVATCLSPWTPEQTLLDQS